MKEQIKYFTPVEACRTLPLVKRIVEDILKTGSQIRRISSRSESDKPNNDLQGLVDKLNEFFSELEQIGCYFKDWNFTIGLVDFPAIIDGQEVLLCWRSDEEDLQFYHEIDAGYAGRKPIPSEYMGKGQS